MSIKMLVVDDEPDLEALIRQKFRKQIREEEYNFIFAQNGLEALNKIIDHPDVSVILSDINMPEMDGLTLLHKLNEQNNPAMKSVIVSAYGDMENIRTAMNRGAFDFLTKPIDFNDLEITINKTLQQLKIIKQAVNDHEELISFQRDLSIANRIQQSILPRIFPPFPDKPEIDIFASMVPAKEVGGDFYDFFFLDKERLGFVIGDVSGKGIPAAIFMASSRTILKTIAPTIPDPGECLRLTNMMLIPESDPAMFVTIFYGIINITTGEVVYSNGGHNSPYIMKASGEVHQIERVGGPLIGKIPHLTFQTHTMKLQPGDTLYLYTDGVTEAMDHQNNLFDEERLVDSLQQIKGLPLETVLKEIHADLKKFAAGAPQSDDITMLALRYNGAKK